MFDNTIAFNKILVSLESTLKIEASGDMLTEEIVKASIDRLENQYNTDFDRDVFSLQDESQLQATRLDQLLRDVHQCLGELAFYTQLKLFHKNLGLSLADVNYLGYERNQLLTALKYLQDDDLYKQYHEAVIEPLTNTLNNTPMCTVKRLFIVLIVLHKLGISEGVATVAQLLYLGGLIV